MKSLRKENYENGPPCPYSMTAVPANAVAGISDVLNNFD